MCKPWEISNRMQCVSCFNNILGNSILFFWELPLYFEKLRLFLGSLFNFWELCSFFKKLCSLFFGTLFLFGKLWSFFWESPFYFEKLLPCFEKLCCVFGQLI